MTESESDRNVRLFTSLKLYIDDSEEKGTKFNIDGN